VHNTAEDHRMRVMFPTDIAVDHAESAGHFTVDSRPNIPPRNEAGEFWPEMQTLPQQVFADVSDGTTGFAVVNNCLTEYQLVDDDRHTLALTLFRAVRNRICTEWRSSGNFPQQKGGQCLRTLEYEYALVPHAGNWERGRVYDEAMALNAPPAVFEVSSNATSRGDLPPTGSFFAIEPAGLVLSCFKKAEDRDTYIVRLFNPTGKTVSGSVRVPETVKKAWLTDLDEQRIKAVSCKQGVVPVSAAPHKIVTLEITC